MADKRRNFELPDDFESEEAFLQQVRDWFAEDLKADQDNRDAALEDAEFMVGAHWDDAIKSKRDKANKPTLTINHIPAFVGQLIGNRRLNQTVAKVIPEHGGTKEIARVREGLIRSIQSHSRARRAYDKAFENQVIGGLGWFQVNVDFASDDVFDQDILINQIPDPNAVVIDRMSIDPTGADARRAFVIDILSKHDFEQMYPDAAARSFSDTTTFGSTLDPQVWSTQTDVRLASFWRMRTRPRILALMRDDGDVEDITDAFIETEDGERTLPRELAARIATRANGEPIMREVNRKYAEMYVISGDATLEGPYRLPISRIPVLKCVGWEVRVGEKTHRWGLVRFMKDPMRFMNYWRSVLADKIMKSPKAKFIASDTAVESYEKEWRKAHLTDDPLLRYNGEAANPPQIVPPIQVEPALIQAAQMALEDLKNVTNLQDASLGIQSNEVSGKAILARQRVGELGTVIYLDNLNMAIEECGRVINELIPVVYDTPRQIKILGEDEKEDLVRINDADNGGPDITTGKYEVTVVTGPSTATKRVEAAESMLTFMNHAPQAAAVIADLIAEAQDWPGAQKIAQRLRTTLPPGMVEQDELSDEQRQQQASQAKQAQQQAQMQQAMFHAELREKEAKAAEAEARAEEAEARRDKTLSEVGVARDKVKIDAFKAESDAEAKDARADLDDAKTINELIGKKEKPNERP